MDCMGLFTQRPEFNDELAGHPARAAARPRATRSDCADAAPIDAGRVGLLGEGGAAIESIVIPVVPVIEIAEVQESGEGADDD